MSQLSTFPITALLIAGLWLQLVLPTAANAQQQANLYDNSYPPSVHHSSWEIRSTPEDGVFTLEIDRYSALLNDEQHFLVFESLGDMGWSSTLPIWDVTDEFQDFDLPLTYAADLDRLGLLHNPEMVAFVNGSLFLDSLAGVDYRQAVLETSIATNFELTSAGQIIGSAPIAISHSLAIGYWDNSGDASWEARQTLEDMGFAPEFVTAFLAGQLDLPGLVASWNANSPRGMTESDGAPTEEEVKDALSRFKVTVQVDGGASADAVQLTITIEGDLYAVEVLLRKVRYDTMKAARKATRGFVVGFIRGIFRYHGPMM